MTLVKYSLITFFLDSSMAIVFLKPDVGKSTAKGHCLAQLNLKVAETLQFEFNLCPVKIASSVLSKYCQFCTSYFSLTISSC